MGFGPGFGEGFGEGFARDEGGGGGEVLTLGGTAVDEAGTMQTSFLDDVSSVPGGARLIAGIAHNSSGLRYVALWPGDGIVTYIGGKAIRPDGAQVILSGAPEVYQSGLGFTNRGELCVTASTGSNRVAGFCVVSGRTSVSELS